MRGPVVTAVVAAAVLAPTLAAAAPHTLSSKKVATGSAAVNACGTLSGITVTWTSQANVVKKVVLSAIPTACNGGTLSLTLVDASNASLGTAGPVTVNATSMTLSTITGSPTATSITGAQVAVVGP
jgi:hypothetical protein